MLKDDIEILNGRITEGPLTPALFLMLKNTKDMPKLCKDLNIERSGEDDNTCRVTTQSSSNAVGRVSLKEWLTNNAQPVTV